MVDLTYLFFLLRVNVGLNYSLIIVNIVVYMLDTIIVDGKGYSASSIMQQFEEYGDTYQFLGNFSFSKRKKII